MKKAIYLILIIPNIFLAQNKLESKLLSSGAYSKMISEELNYLILGETSPQQGFGFTLNEDTSNLKISGLLSEWDKSLITAEADLSVSEGIYFFDEEGGSKQSKISVNFFQNLWINSVYIDNNEESYTAKLLMIQELLKEKAGKYNELLKILETKSLPVNTKEKDNAKEELIDFFKKFQLTYDSSKSYGFDLKDYKRKSTEKVWVNNKYINVQTDYKLSKVYEGYREIVANIKNKLEDEIYDLERRLVKSHWTSHKLLFLGVKGFYQRESFRRFTYDPILTFTNMFSDERGDVFGGEVSLNFNYNMETRNRWWQINNFFGRVTGKLRRASNISTFKNKALAANSSLGNDVNGLPISSTNSDNAFIGENLYEYGFGTSIDVDLYAFPCENIPLGVFLEFSHEYISFDEDKGVDNIQLTPLRLGLLYNLKNKEKDKPIVSISLFMDRTDLSLSPNGNDNDLRFGLGVGIPVNFR